MVELYEDDDIGDGDAEHTGQAAPGHREVATPRHGTLRANVLHQVLDPSPFIVINWEVKYNYLSHVYQFLQFFNIPPK